MTNSTTRTVRLRQALIGVALVGLLSGCAHHYLPETFADPYGFFSGIWHGMVLPYSLMTNIASWVLSLLSIDLLSGVQIVGRPNTGLFYYIGFFLGLSVYSGTAASSH